MATAKEKKEAAKAKAAAKTLAKAAAKAAKDAAKAAEKAAKEAAKEAAKVAAPKAAAPRTLAPNEGQLDQFMGDKKISKISTDQMNQLRMNMSTIHPLENRIGKYKLSRGTMNDHFTISVVE